MAELALAYRLTEDVHSSFYVSGRHLSPTEIRLSGIRADISEISKTERLTTFGRIEDKRVYQHLSRSPKTGYFHLSTVFTDPGGAVRQARITPDAEPKHVQTIAETLFMQAILRIARTRELIERLKTDQISPDSPKINFGDVFKHLHGTTYEVDALVARAEGNEETGSLGLDVVYTQLDDGEVNPAGTQYTRSIEEFLYGMAEQNGEFVPIFQRHD